MTRDVDVLIVGAGPTGLVLALWLTRLGVRVRIVDKTEQPGTTSRALAVHARTLELYRQIGLADAVVARGRPMAAINLWAAGRQVAHAVLGDMGAGISPLPVRADFSAGRARTPADRSPCATPASTSSAGPSFWRSRRPAAVCSPDSGGRMVRATRARRPTSPAATARIPRSARRSRLDFQAAPTNISSTSPTSRRAAPVMNGELHAALDTSDFLAVFPLKEDGHARLIGTVRDRRRTPARESVLGRRQHARDRVDAHRRRARALVLDLPRAPSRRRSVPQGSRVPARRRGAHPQSGGWAGDEHRYRRRREPRVETRRRAAADARTRRCSTATSRNASPSRGAWSRRPIRRSRG